MSEGQAGPRSTYMYWSTAGDWARGLAICVVAGVFLSIAGAFGMDRYPLGQRLLYWVPMMVAGGLIGTAIARPVFRSAWFANRGWLGCVLVTLLLTPPLSLLVWLHTTWVFERDWDIGAIRYFLVPVALISGLMTAINYMADRRPRETHAAAPGAAPPRFLDRLPMKLKGAELYAVEAEDHYLRLHTDRGSDLILMRLSDAVTELEGIEGAQTHRSWWVAKDAVVEVARGDGRATFVLKNGARAPVSRTYAPSLRAEGWY